MLFGNARTVALATDAPAPTLPRHELAAVAVGVTLPAIQILVALSTTGVFVQRYALVAIPTLCIAIALALRRLVQAAVMEVTIAVVLTVSFAASATFRATIPNPARQRPALMSLLAQERPVLVTGGRCICSCGRTRHRQCRTTCTIPRRPRRRTGAPRL